MGIVPDSKQGKVTFFRSKIAPWTSAATAIGTTPEAVTALDALVTTAEEKLAAQTSAEGAYRAAVEEAKQAIEAMATAGAGIISAIRTKGRTDSGVWALAQIPAPATPSPVGSPGTPYKLKVELNPNGSVGMTFKCDNPRGCDGVIYQVYRKLQPGDAYQYVGGTGSRKFVDTSVPAGVPSVMYAIQGTRSTAIGTEAEFVVNFGVGAGGTAIVTPVAKATKQAA